MNQHIKTTCPNRTYFDLIKAPYMTRTPAQDLKPGQRISGLYRSIGPGEVAKRSETATVVRVMGPAVRGGFVTVRVEMADGTRTMWLFTPGQDVEVFD